MSVLTLYDNAGSTNALKLHPQPGHHQARAAIRRPLSPP